MTGHHGKASRVIHPAFARLEERTSFAYRALVKVVKAPDLEGATFLAGLYDSLKKSAEVRLQQRLECLPRLSDDGFPDRYTLQIIFGRVAAHHMEKEMRCGLQEKIKMELYEIKGFSSVLGVLNGTRPADETDAAKLKEAITVLDNSIKRGGRAYDRVYGHLHDPDFSFQEVARFARRIPEESSMGCLVSLVEYVRTYFLIPSSRARP